MPVRDVSDHAPSCARLWQWMPNARLIDLKMTDSTLRPPDERVHPGSGVRPSRKTLPVALKAGLTTVRTYCSHEVPMASKWRGPVWVSGSTTRARSALLIE